MRTHHIVRIFALSGAALMLATSVQAQGKSEGQGKGKDGHGDHSDRVEVSKGDPRHQGDEIDRDRRDDHGNLHKVPPGLAKKPGQMPPGQYKKHYRTSEGADVLGGILRRRGYTVSRVQPAGQSQYVSYRLQNGSERRVIVSPGTDHLVFSNLPASLVSEVMAKLY